MWLIGYFKNYRSNETDKAFGKKTGELTFLCHAFWYFFCNIMIYQNMACFALYSVNLPLGYGSRKGV